MGPESIRFASLARRARAVLVALAVAAFGLAFTACSDDEGDKALEDAQERVDDAQEELDSVGDEAGGEIEKGIDEAQKKANEIQDDVEKEAGE